MKLLFCWECYDLFKLHRYPGHCKCGKSAGHYLEDGDHIEVIGQHCDVVGIDNRSFMVLRGAHKSAPTEEIPFGAWMYPRDYYKIHWRLPDGTEQVGTRRHKHSQNAMAKSVLADWLEKQRLYG